MQAQNAIQPSGTVDAGAEKIAIRVSGQFTSEESLNAINFRANGRFFRLSDIAKVRRAYVDPQQPMFRFNGRPAIGLGISMKNSRSPGSLAGVAALWKQQWRGSHMQQALFCSQLYRS